MEKEKILKDVYELIEKEGCYQDVMNVVNFAWTKYKGKIDENLAAIDLLIEDLIDRDKAKNMLKNENKQGHLRLELFPYFRKKIKKIANS